jgi:L-asparaginase II
MGADMKDGAVRKKGNPRPAAAPLSLGPMPSNELRVEATRGDLVESMHHVSVAVVDAKGRLIAASGNPGVTAWWRSAAKPFQALPLLEDGAADRFGLDSEELALACGSHSSEPAHLAVVRRFMEKVGVTEAQLSCGTHTPLSAEVARAVNCGSAAPTPAWSNCSGKHTGMLALARHHGWPLEGYHAAGHPVQERILRSIAQWSGVATDDLKLAVDGCTAVCFGLPVQAMALAYARLGASQEPAARRVVAAMMGHPLMVAGTGRLCTDLMTAWPGGVVSKIGAEGVYGAAIPELELGVALKVEDGDMPSSGRALLEVLRQLLSRMAPERTAVLGAAALVRHGSQPIRNTRDVITGELRAAGELRFFDG